MPRLESALLDLAASAGTVEPAGRLATLLACTASAGELEQDTPGLRNQRLLALHRQLIGGAIEACAVCPECTTQNEFDVPADSLLALPAPAPHAVIEVDGVGAYRLPRMADLAAVGASAALARDLALRCRIRSDAPDPLDGAALDRIGAAFERADPAASIVIAIACAQCGHRFRSAVDVALLVEPALARLGEGLLRDVDSLAAAYGWSEEQILALPSGRRRRYVALTAERGRAPRLAVLGGGQ